METVERIIARFSRALSTYDQHAEAQQLICQKLLTLLQSLPSRHYRRALEIGCGTGGFTRLLQENCVVDEWYLNDLCSGCEEKLVGRFEGQMMAFIAGDAEEIALPDQLDLIASASAFQWMKAPERFLQKLAKLLMPSGVCVFNTFAPGNLREIKQLTGKGLHYPTAEQLAAWLAEDFNVLHLQQEEIELHFDTPIEVLRHLKYTGVTATGDGNWTRSQQAEFCRNYTALYETKEHQVTLTYCPIYVVAVKKQCIQ